MRWYPWLNITYNKILNSYRKDRGHHALILNSKRDNGEDILIYAIVRWLICSHPNETKCCNICHDCKLMNIGHHPDYYKVSSKNNIDKTIGVDIIRDNISSIYYHAYQSKVKIIFIEYVEHLTDQAGNILLKILDEPPSNTYFFFKTRDYAKIPLTLLSRCMRWLIFSPKESVGLRWLMQHEEISDILLAQCALRLCDGAPIEAKAMFESGLWEKRLELCKSINHVILSGDFLKLVSFLNTCKHNICLYWFITVLADALKWKQGVNKSFLTNLDQVELIVVVAAQWSMLSLSRQLQQWLILLRYFQELINIDRELLLTYRLLNWKRDIVESFFY